MTLCETLRGAFLPTASLLKAPKNLVMQQFPRWRQLKVGRDCDCAQIAKKRGSSLKAEVSLRGAAALMDARACWCYITTKCRGLLESPDASLMSDAMLESSRDVETSKNCENGPSRCFRPCPSLAFKARFPVEINPGLNYCNLGQGCEIKDPN